MMLTLKNVVMTALKITVKFKPVSAVATRLPQKIRVA
jgi:hypothetical protein